jgi:hypothetical protein
MFKLCQWHTKAAAAAAALQTVAALAVAGESSRAEKNLLVSSTEEDAEKLVFEKQSPSSSASLCLCGERSLEIRAESEPV